MGGIASRANLPLATALVAAAVAIALALLPAAADAAPRDLGTQRTVVVLSDGVSVKRYARERGITPIFTFKKIFTGFAADLTPEQRQELRQESRVEGVSLARMTRRRPFGFRAAGAAPHEAVRLPESRAGRIDASCEQVVPNAVRRVGALESPTARINCRADRTFGAAVAVLDSGIDAQHPDLNVVGGHQCVEGAADPLTDVDGHGTQVAGLIGARDNAIGLVGVAPGVPLYAVKMFDDAGRSDLANALCALEWVAQNRDRVDVANMSWASVGAVGSDTAGCAPAGASPSELLRAAICRVERLGVVPVASAGNTSTDLGLGGVIPAGFPEALTVAAIADFDGQPGGLAPPDGCFADEDDTFANFSDFGAPVDISAPGVCNSTTAPVAACGQPLALDTGCYTTTVGTSFAAPLVAGAAALIRQREPAAGAGEVRDRLVGGAEAGPIPQDPDGAFEGVLNVRGR